MCCRFVSIAFCVPQCALVLECLVVFDLCLKLCMLLCGLSCWLMLWIGFGLFFQWFRLFVAWLFKVGVCPGVLGRPVMVFYASIAGFAC